MSFSGKYKRPETQLFMLMSLDGKISTGEYDEFDFDQDLPALTEVAKGLHQYYDLEKETNVWSLITGKTLQKMCDLNFELPKTPIPITLVIVDTNYLGVMGMEWASRKYANIILASSNDILLETAKLFPNIRGYAYPKHKLDVLFSDLRSKFGCEKLTLQCGGAMNCALFRQGLVDHLNIVVAPIIIGGSSTPTLVDGLSICSTDGLLKLPVLKLVEAKALQHNYLHLHYNVIKNSLSTLDW